MRWSVLLACWACGLVFAQVEPDEAPDLAEELVPEAAVPEEAIPEYFGDKPERFLVDPQELLAPKVRTEQEGFLEYHSRDSEIDFYVLVFDGGQEIPAGIRVEEMAERFFGQGKPALIALYFLGEPERVRLLLSPQLAEEVQVTELRRLRAEAVRAGQAEDLASEQLEEFCVQLAIGIFWMERAAGLVGDPEVRLRPEPEGTSPPGEDQHAPAGPLQAWRERLEEWLLPAAVVLGAMLAAFLLRWIVARRARYEFPLQKLRPRLGGERGAGIGALVEFRNRSQSPSRQKRQSSDPLGDL